MAREISDLALAVISTGAHYSTRCTITPPGGAPIEVNHADGWSVTDRAPARLASGPALGISSLELLPTDGIDDLFAFAGIYGAIYDVFIGIKLGITIEWIQVFSGYAVEGTSKRNRLGVIVSLQDPWAWVDEVPFEDEYVTTVGVSRANTVAEIFTPTIYGLTTRIEGNGGYIASPNVYDGKRGETAAKIARDGLLQAMFDGKGELVIKPHLDITGDLTPLWQFSSGQSDAVPSNFTTLQPATIVRGELERIRPWKDSLYNAVTVSPAGSEQTWTKQTAKLADPYDPRHEAYVGFRPYEYVSDTIANGCDALDVANYGLTYLLRGTSERVRVKVLLNPAVEKNDVFWPTAMPTLDDPGWNGTYIATNVTHSPSEATTTIEGVSALGYVLGQ